MIAQGWTDEDLPVTICFGYLDERQIKTFWNFRFINGEVLKLYLSCSVNENVVLGLRSEAVNQEWILPQGDSENRLFDWPSQTQTSRICFENMLSAICLCLSSQLCC
jgi:hypothetical protein